MLNAVPGGPILQRKDWNSRLQDWRHSLNKKQRKCIVEHNSTGGGSSNAAPLKDYELRALHLFNSTTVTGNRELLIEAGISREFKIPEDLQDHSRSEAVSPMVEEYIIDENNQSNSQDNHHQLQPVPLSASSSRSRSKRPRRQRSRSRSAHRPNVEMYLEKIEQIEQKKTEAQKALVEGVCSSINNFAGAIAALAEAISADRNNN